MKSEFSDMQTIIDAYTFINKRPSIHGQAEARFMARAGPGSYSVGRQFFNLERQDTKGPRAYVVNEARMSMQHKLVDSPGYEMYNQFISNLPDDKKPLFEDLQPNLNHTKIGILLILIHLQAVHHIKFIILVIMFL